MGRLAPALATLGLLASALAADERQPTPDVGLGPNHRAGAPFRAKLSPPHAEGTVLVIKGHVRDAASGKPIPGAVLDAFHADAAGEYDMQGFDYRARMLVDEQGYYEFETIRPQSYGPPPHIHLAVTADGYATLRTEILFRDATQPAGGRPELTVALVERTASGRGYLEGSFDVRLRAEGRPAAAAE
jgi:protocatechuate 3,4-dioxygenase beta subunit